MSAAGSNRHRANVARGNSSPFRFCPICAGRLEDRIEYEEEGRAYPTCAGCGFIFYQSSKPTASALIERDGRLLLLRRRQAPYHGWWDTPGGFLEPGEPPEEGMRREVREETGLEVAPRELLGIFMDVYRHGPAPTPTLNLFYRADVIGGQERGSHETTAPRWFAPDELPARIAFECVRRAVTLWQQHTLPVGPPAEAVRTSQERPENRRHQG